MDPLGIAGIAVSLGIAWWQHVKAKKAERTADEAIRAIPEKVGRVIAAVLPTGKPEEKPGEPPRGWYEVKYADIDGDGSDEVLIQFPAGAHGSGLKVFGRRDHDLVEIGDLRTGTPVGFEIRDVDGDGRIEISTEETDWTAGQPYVSAPRLRVVYRWDGKAFAEVSRSASP